MKEIAGPLPRDALERIATALRRAERFDLAAYRPAYAARRIGSRLASTGEGPADYARRVETDAAERRALVECLGVNVTSFFRDAGVWLFLEEVALPPLVDEAVAEDGVVRALSLGCAGGQEAYSSAMLLSELLGGRLERFQVDAWDMDEAALEMAREAWYPREAAKGLSEAAVARYFERSGDGLRVAEDLRRRVRVSRHDMLTEDMRGEYDLVFLRNVLIYFDREAKEKLFRRLHGSLSRRGLLVLGQTETIGERAEALFRPLSLRNRVYGKVAA